eukprot:TRINITY_DN2998_c0_g1_i3.p1 TRINITY_DN2998_c0_g1~~TRINITY_DN2998_c0_g1_i3.p1  ORF type:complete len:303 (-),score=101.81 TRINITY_DN2998_c0_g1_i3:158-1039(-)
MASEALLAEALGAVLASKCDWVIVRPEGHGKFTVAGKGGGGLKALVPNLGVADVLFSLFRVQGKKCTRFIWLTWIGEEVSARKVSKRTKYTIKLPETDPPIVSTTCTSIEQLAANVESAVKVAETTTKQKKEKEKDQLLLSLKHRRHHSTAASTEQLQQLALRSPRGKASSLSVSASPIDDMQVSHARHRSELAAELEKAREEIRVLRTQLSAKQEPTENIQALKQQANQMVQELQQVLAFVSDPRAAACRERAAAGAATGEHRAEAADTAAAVIVTTAGNSFNSGGRRRCGS